jgi:hypothetical protein
LGLLSSSSSRRFFFGGGLRTNVHLIDRDWHRTHVFCSPEILMHRFFLLLQASHGLFLLIRLFTNAAPSTGGDAGR